MLVIVLGVLGPVLEAAVLEAAVLEAPVLEAAVLEAAVLEEQVLVQWFSLVRPYQIRQTRSSPEKRRNHKCRWSLEKLKNVTEKK
jgi:hypothetical protein